MLATLVVLGSALLVTAAPEVATAAQPYDTGSLNATIAYTPAIGWSEYIAPGGFEMAGNQSVAVFASKLTNESTVNWTMPCMFFCLPT
jgi:hypothetical protein